MRHLFIIIVVLALFGLLIPLNVRSEFYKYIDKNGKAHFVDDISRIPTEYREDLKTYKERYDHLSDTEKQIRLDKDRQKAEESRKKLIHQKKKQHEAEKRRREQIEKEKRQKNLVTEVTIRGNKVLVPVKLGYGRKEVTALLVLDTGAEIVLLHKDVSDQLSIKKTKKSSGRVAGGGTVSVGITKLKYIETGPHKKTDLMAAIIATEGELDYQGLLGMNFLKGLEYSIDFEAQVIRWKP